MKQTPLVSIIIPTYNRAHLIGETLDSVIAQTYTNWECIVVDDGSTDNTSELLQGYCNKDARFQYHQRPSNRLKGANACRNYGFELSKGRWIQLLDSDDVLDFFCIKERVNLVIMDNTINLLIRDTSIIEKGIIKEITINEDPNNQVIEEYLRMFLRYELPWTIMGVFYKREILEKYKFDENLGRFQDVSFNIKVLSKFENLKILRDYKIDSYYRVEKTKELNKDFVNNIIRSLITFNKSHKNLIKNNNYRNDLRKFNYKIMRSIVIPYFRFDKKIMNNLLFFLLKTKTFNLIQKINILFLSIFLNFNLYNFKGIGMYKFNNLFKKIMTN